MKAAAKGTNLRGTTTACCTW